MGNMGWPDDKVDKAVAICRFTVNENGEIMNIRVIKGTHPAFDKEAIRILSNFPRLIPAMKNSKPVPYDYFLTMRFWKEDLEHYLLYRECAQEDLEKTTWEPYRYSSYPGGTVALTQFINSHLKITPEMKATGKQGRVTLDLRFRCFDSFGSPPVTLRRITVLEGSFCSSVNFRKYL